MSQNTLSVGFDVTPILYNRGVSRYTTNIVRSLGKLESQIQLSLFGSSFRSHKLLRSMAKTLAKEARSSQSPTIHAFPPSFLKTMWYTAGRLHIESLCKQVDVFHAWEELIPPSYKTPIVATIHDLAIFKFADIGLSSTMEKHEAAIARLKAYKSQVIAVSQQTKRDLCEIFSFDEHAITVIPEALPRESVVDPSQLLSRLELEQLGIVRPYILWVGVPEKRKNLERMIQAWKNYAKEVDFVLVSGQDIHSYVEPGIIPVRADTRTLASLYTHAKALVFVSLYEGFGLPILEAFHYGCPVVTGNCSGMSETALDAAILVDPFDVDAIAAGIRQVLQKEPSAPMRKKMKQRLGAFSWDKSAKQTLHVYQKAKLSGK